jgi:hypothetical protein
VPWLIAKIWNGVTDLLARSASHGDSHIFRTVLSRSLLRWYHSSSCLSLAPPSTRVVSLITSCGICGWQSGACVDFHRVLILIIPTAHPLPSSGAGTVGPVVAYVLIWPHPMNNKKQVFWNGLRKVLSYIQNRGSKSEIRCLIGWDNKMVPINIKISFNLWPGCSLHRRAMHVACIWLSRRVKLYHK